MKKTFLRSLIFLCTIFSASAQSYKFDFTDTKKVKEGYIKISPTDRYSEEKGYGYDLQPSPDGKSNAPFFFSVSVPDGNYHVTAVIGNRKKAGITSVRGESRRLFAEKIVTQKKEETTFEFTINKTSNGFFVTIDSNKNFFY